MEQLSLKNFVLKLHSQQNVISIFLKIAKENTNIAIFATESLHYLTLIWN